MINIKELPKEPTEALTETLTLCLSNIKRGPARFKDLKNGNHPIANNLIVATMIASKSASSIGNPELLELITRCIYLDDDYTVDKIVDNLETALNAVIAYQLDDHFIDQEAVELFGKAELDQDEKAEIRLLMAEARLLVDRSAKLSVRQRKNVLYHVSKIENELHKDKSNFQTFVAAAYDVSGILKRVGDDAQPLAEAIKKARTITERKVEGRLEIGQDEEPKQLPKPD